MNLPKMLALVSAVSIGLSSAAFSNETAEQISPKIFTLEKQGDNLVRMNNQTGELSICKIQDEDLVCRLAIEESKALNDEIDRLNDKLANLQKDQRELSTTDEKIDTEIDKAINFSSKVMRRFFDVMKELRDEYNTQK